MKPSAYTPDESMRRLTLSFILLGFAHLAVGILLGFLQGMEHAGVNLYRFIPGLQHYYQGLSMHGVFNALLFTTAFIVGFVGFVTGYALRRPLHSMGLAWATFWVLTVGMALTDYALLTNEASVLYTFYAPLQAHPAYYIGLALVVVSTLMLTLNMILTYLGWKRDNPGRRTPLIAFGALATMIMWSLSTVGIVVEVVGLLIPWSLGLLEGVDPLLTRTLFWMTGHPLVYFWLLPAYVSWYFILPKLAGGKLFSESLARLAFLLFIPLSLPVGIHHQFLDPGVSEGVKALHAFITFGVFMPSMITAFTVLASLETAGRARGGKGLLGWIRALPWHEPAFVPQALGMVLFALGGISGLVNASYTVNLVVHNTLFVPGHFHLTVGSAVTLTFMALTYWLVPSLTGRKLWSRRVAVWQAWLWFVGMALLSRGMSWAGILGAPRRTALGQAPYALQEWAAAFNLSAVGGAILTISGVLFFVNLIATLWRSPKGAVETVVPEAEPLHPEEPIPWYLDRFAPWVVGAAVLLVIAYGPPLVDLVRYAGISSPGLRPY